jgi:hypothetical protein
MNGEILHSNVVTFFVRGIDREFVLRTGERMGDDVHKAISDHLYDVPVDILLPIPQNFTRTQVYDLLYGDTISTFVLIRPYNAYTMWAMDCIRVILGQPSWYTREYPPPDNAIKILTKLAVHTKMIAVRERRAAIIRQIFSDFADKILEHEL